MLLFDLEDILPIIGTCPNREQWDDLAITARATRDAFLKALTEWYEISTYCLDKSDPCYIRVTTQWKIMQDFLESTYTPIFDKFWDSLVKDGGTFTTDICNQYRKMMIEWRCHVKKLLRLVDNDFSSEQLDISGRITYTISLYE